MILKSIYKVLHHVKLGNYSKSFATVCLTISVAVISIYNQHFKNAEYLLSGLFPTPFS